MSKKCLIINQSHTSNLGDKIIGNAMKELFYDYDLTIAPYIPTQKMESITASKTDRFLFVKKIIDFFKLTTLVNDMRYSLKIKTIIKKNFDFAIIGGGELLSGNIEFNSAFKSWVDVLYAKKIPVIVAGVSGSETSDILGNRYKKALEKCSSVFVRDYDTQKLLRLRYGVDSEYCPDFAFSLNKNEKNKNDNYLCQIYCYDYGASELGIDSREKYYDYWIKEIKRVSNDLEKVILSFSDKDDKKETLRFNNYLRNKYGIQLEVIGVENETEMVDCISEQKGIITGRMHPMIVALVHDVKIFPIPVKKKIETFTVEWEKCDYDKIDWARKKVIHLKEQIDEITEKGVKK